MAIIQDVQIDNDFITLGQFLKLIDAVSSGGEVRDFLSFNQVYVNEEKEERRGRKLYKNDLIQINKKQYRICWSEN